MFFIIVLTLVLHYFTNQTCPASSVQPRPEFSRDFQSCLISWCSTVVSLMPYILFWQKVKKRRNITHGVVAYFPGQLAHRNTPIYIIEQTMHTQVRSFWHRCFKSVWTITYYIIKRQRRKNKHEILQWFYKHDPVQLSIFRCCTVKYFNQYSHIWQKPTKLPYMLLRL